MRHRSRSHGGVRSHRRMLHRGSGMECRRGGPRHCRCAHVWRRRGGSGHRRCGSRARMCGLLCGGADASGNQKGAANSGHHRKRKPNLLGKHGARLPLIQLPHIKNARMRKMIRWFAFALSSLFLQTWRSAPSPASNERTRQMIDAPSSGRGRREIRLRHLTASLREPMRNGPRWTPLAADARDQ